jgi:DNA-binding MltR family transcriptional regulator
MTIIEALSNTGGIMGFIYVAIEVFIKGIQEFLFF